MQNFINQGPNKTYEHFAQTIYTLSDKRLAIQEIGSLFLSLHGFVTHYLGHVSNYEEVKDLAKFHIDFLLRPLT